MARTKQQSAAIKAAINPKNNLVKIQACAGAGKTYTLIELVKDLQPSSGTYLAYNKAISDEATIKFKGTNIACSTIHSLAYKYIVKPYGLQVGFLNARDIAERLTFANKKLLIDTLETFFLSAATDPTAYAVKHLPAPLQPIFMSYLHKMSVGDIKCTHSFYLKLFHIYLSTGEVTVPEVEVLLLDEFGDVTELTLEIFKLLPAKTKVAVGDPMQNIYSFNNTINGFEALKDEGISTDMTESFRVSAFTAKRVEKFVQRHCDKSFQFKGHKYAGDEESSTFAYISRTNSGLLHKMFELMEEGIPFAVTRDISTMLKTPLALIDTIEGDPINGYEFKHLETLRNNFYKSPKTAGMTIGKYIEFCTRHDPELVQAIKVIRAHGKADLKALERYVLNCAKRPQAFTLTTAHSAKGLEFHEVEIADDLNASTVKAIIELENCEKWGKAYLNHSAMEELRLYYVATTRCLYKLHNATAL